MDSEYRALMRRKLLEDIYDKMSDEEKRIFVLYTMQDRNHEEIMAALQGVNKQVEESKHSWAADFGANVAGNAVWSGLMWIGGRLFRSIRI